MAQDREVLDDVGPDPPVREVVDVPAAEADGVRRRGVTASFGAPSHIEPDGVAGYMSLAAISCRHGPIAECQSRSPFSRFV